MAKLNKAASTAIRVVISAFLITFLIVRNWDNFRMMANHLESINITLMALATFLYFLGIAGMVFRWGILLRAQQIIIHRGFLLQSVMIGFFYNNILPTSVGGDAYRVYDIYKNKRIPVDRTVSTVVLERSMGTITGAIFLVFSFFFGMYDIISFNMLLSLIIVLALLILLMAVLIKPYFFKVDRLFEKFALLRKIRPKVKSFREILLSYKDKKVYLGVCFIYSAIIQMLIILSYWLMSESLTLDIGLSSFYLLSPLPLSVASIPITIGGIGLRENALAFLVATLGPVKARLRCFHF
ncbi:MAG: lysylphosphatidylglycerol synthase transmembrane domain-containing protein [Actinomycetota bacterium]|nr:lysylphosphatidylglycerol synthase transmembrane domain-containing protein [Actinomycetota bacterium]